MAVDAGFVHEAVTIADVEAAAHIMAEVAEPADHIGPGKQDGNSDGLVGGILRMPAVNGDGKAALAIIVRQHGRELLKHNVSGKFLPAIVVPGLGIERIIIAGADRVIPLP